MNKTLIAKRQARPQQVMFGESKKFTVTLTDAEILTAQELARIVAVPGTVLNVQDVLRISLANHAKRILPTAPVTALATPASRSSRKAGAAAR